MVLEKKENQLEINIYDKIKRNFSLNLIEVESEDKEMPSLEFSSRIEMMSSYFVEAVEDCAVVDDACSFIVKDGKFIIEAKSLNSARSEFSSDEVKIEAEDCKARYSLEYLQKFVKGAKLCDRAILNFANEHPLRLDFKAGHFELSFILAPRVETDN